MVVFQTAHLLIMLNSTAEICGPPALESLYVQGMITQLWLMNLPFLWIVPFIKVTVTFLKY